MRVTLPEMVSSASMDATARSTIPWAALLVSTIDLDLGGEREYPFAMTLYQPGWHQGVIGILASRIKDRLHRPTIAFADGDGGTLKGSARSIAGIHIRDVLDAVACRHPGLIDQRRSLIDL